MAEQSTTPVPYTGEPMHELFGTEPEMICLREKMEKECYTATSPEHMRKIRNKYSVLRISLRQKLATAEKEKEVGKLEDENGLLRYEINDLDSQIEYLLRVVYELHNPSEGHL